MTLPCLKMKSEAVDMLILDTLHSLHRVLERLDDLEKLVANLETQRTPQDENDDPEWY